MDETYAGEMIQAEYPLNTLIMVFAKNAGVMSVQSLTLQSNAKLPNINASSSCHIDLSEGLMAGIYLFLRQ